jgi:hypothetical protein
LAPGRFLESWQTNIPLVNPAATFAAAAASMPLLSRQLSALALSATLNVRTKALLLPRSYTLNVASTAPVAAPPNVDASR